MNLTGKQNIQLNTGNHRFHQLVTYSCFWFDVYKLDCILLLRISLINYVVGRPLRSAWVTVFPVNCAASSTHLSEAMKVFLAWLCCVRFSAWQLRRADRQNGVEAFTKSWVLTTPVPAIDRATHQGLSEWSHCCLGVDMCRKRRPDPGSDSQLGTHIVFMFRCLDCL